MVSITMDHSALIFYDRYPPIGRLIKLEEEGKLRLYHAQNLNRDLATMSKTEQKIYDALRNMVFGKAQQDLNLAEHGDLVLLVNHMKNGRDYFLTMEQKKYASLQGHRHIDVRFPDKKFIREIEERLGITSEANAKKHLKTKSFKKPLKKASANKRK